MHQNHQTIPNENSLVGKPDAERAATGADGPGTGMIGIFFSTHIFAYIRISNEDYYLLHPLTLPLPHTKISYISATHQFHTRIADAWHSGITYQCYNFSALQSSENGLLSLTFVEFMIA